MGLPMARNMARAGLDVRAWNRTADKARPVQEDGGQVVEDAGEAGRGADIVVTMLADTDAVLGSVRPALEAAGSDVLWLQMSTLGERGTERCLELAQELGVVMLDAPVLGTKAPAEQGKLVVLASGPDDVQDRLAPVFDAIGSKTLWLGEAGNGSRLKLACNAWVFMVTAGVAQSIALTRALGLDPQSFLDAVEGGPLDLPYLHLKAANMIDGEHPIAFGLTGAAKDARLIRDALRQAGVDDRLDAAVLATMEAAAGRLDDPGAVDLSALVEGL
jgi:3-hydroxyisobutyrate dehydrogenase